MSLEASSFVVQIHILTSAEPVRTYSARSSDETALPITLSKSASAMADCRVISGRVAAL